MRGGEQSGRSPRPSPGPSVARARGEGRPRRRWRWMRCDLALPETTQTGKSGKREARRDRTPFLFKAAKSGIGGPNLDQGTKAMKFHHVVASTVMLAALAVGAAPAGASVTHNALTSNALTANSITHNALANNAITHNALANNAVTQHALANNAVTQNSLTFNGVAPTGSGLGELNCIAIEAVQAPERR